MEKFLVGHSKLIIDHPLKPLYPLYMDKICVGAQPIVVSENTKKF